MAEQQLPDTMRSFLVGYVFGSAAQGLYSKEDIVEDLITEESAKAEAMLDDIPIDIQSSLWHLAATFIDEKTTPYENDFTEDTLREQAGILSAEFNQMFNRE